MQKKLTGRLIFSITMITLLASCGGLTPEPSITNFKASSHSVEAGATVRFTISGSITTADTNDFADLTGTVELLIDGQVEEFDSVEGNYYYEWDVTFSDPGEYSAVLQVTATSGAAVVESDPISITVTEPVAQEPTYTMANVAGRWESSADWFKLGADGSFEDYKGVNTGSGSWELDGNFIIIKDSTESVFATAKNNLNIKLVQDNGEVIINLWYDNWPGSVSEYSSTDATINN